MNKDEYLSLIVFLLPCTRPFSVFKDLPKKTGTKIHHAYWPGGVFFPETLIWNVQKVFTNSF